MKEKIKGIAYRIIMKIAHKYNWHYAPPIYPNGDTQLWCKWCGFRQTIKICKKKGIKKEKSIEEKIEELEADSELPPHLQIVKEWVDDDGTWFCKTADGSVSYK